MGRRRKISKTKKSSPENTPHNMAVTATNKMALTEDDNMEPKDYLSNLSLELLVKIMTYLPLRCFMRLESLNSKLQHAVSMHIQIRKWIDFSEGKYYAYMPDGFNDESFKHLLLRSPDLQYVFGLNPCELSRRWTRGSDRGCSIPGIVEALQACPKLLGVQTCHVQLLESILAYLPLVEILGKFYNRNGTFPPNPQKQLTIPKLAKIRSLHLTGVTLPELPQIVCLEEVILEWVKLTNPQPFSDFGSRRLHTFIMRNCAGPTSALKYVPLVTGLAASRRLKRLELIRVPFLGGLFQHVVEDAWKIEGFRKLRKIVLGACKNCLEIDLGYLVVSSASWLEQLAVQPSLTKDSLFTALKLADVDFPQFDILNLGYVHPFPDSEHLSNEKLVRHGLADVSENPSLLTDNGMKAASHVFTLVRVLSAYNCPHLHKPSTWIDNVYLNWAHLARVHLRRCHAIKLDSFCSFIDQLDDIRDLVLEHMFREPPKGCARVGLSAGTGIGVSSALVTNNSGNNDNDDNADDNQQQVQDGAPPVQAEEPGKADEQKKPGESDDKQQESKPDAAPSTSSAADNSQAGSSQAPESSVNTEHESVDMEVDDTNDKNGIQIPENTSNQSCQAVSQQIEEETNAAKKAAREARDRDIIRDVVVEEPKSEKDGDKDVDMEQKSEKDGDKEVAMEQSDEATINNWEETPQVSDSTKDNDQEDKTCMNVVASEGVSNEAGSGGSTEEKDNISPSSSIDSKGGSTSGKRTSSQRSSTSSPAEKQLEESLDPSTGESKTKERETPVRRVTRQMTRRNSQGETTQALDVSGVPEPLSNGKAKSKSDKELSPAKHIKPKPVMCDRATSTSDPVMEDDPVQTMTLSNDNLEYINMFWCGISHLDLKGCKKLNALNATACRILKSVKLDGLLDLRAVKFTQCYKLRNDEILREVLKIPAKYNKFVHLRPMYQFNITSLERMLFSNLIPHNYHVMLALDYTNPPRAENATFMRNWSQALNDLTFDMIDTFEMPSASDMERPTKYPWGRNIRRHTLNFEKTGCQMDIISDVPWLHEVLNVKDMPFLDPFCEEAVRYMNNMAYNIDRNLDVMYAHILEMMECKFTHFKNSVVVYIQMCDIDGIPADDPYA